MMDNPLMAVAVAASLGRQWLEADGVRVDRAAFDQVVATLDFLAKVIDQTTRVTSHDSDRNLPDDGLMTTTEVAAVAGIGPHGVRKAARDGRLAATRTDQGWRYTPDAVAAWKENRG